MEIRRNVGKFLTAHGNKMQVSARHRQEIRRARDYAKRTNKTELPGFIAVKHSFTVGEAIEALKHFPKDKTLWVRWNGGGMGGPIATGCGYIGYVENNTFGSMGDKPAYVVAFQPLSPEDEAANRARKRP